MMVTSQERERVEAGKILDHAAENGDANTQRGFTAEGPADGK